MKSAVLLVIGVTALVLALHCTGVEATYGMDLSSPISLETAKCLRGQGFEFAIVRGWESIGQVDSSVFGSVSNLWAAGFAHVDVYFFPCFKCGDPRGQVQRAVDAFRSRGLKFGMMWFDIETPPSWGSCSENVAFLSDLVNEAQTMGIHVGIYASESMWSSMMCNHGGFSSVALWYAHWDNTPSFSDFRSFGGWTKPAMKQITGDSHVCGFDIDKDWY